jgi:hypothetical protein
MVASGGGAAKTTVWDIATGKARQLKGPQDESRMQKLAFSPDSRYWREKSEWPGMVRTTTTYGSRTCARGVTKGKRGPTPQTRVTGGHKRPGHSRSLYV